MKRNRKIAIVAHCVLNQNAVLTDWERSEGPFKTYVQPLMEQGVSLLQLPCPELTFGGVGREPLTYADYDNMDYRNHCQRLLEPFFMHLEALLKDGCEVVNLIGIENSPSCDLRPGNGVFMEVFFRKWDALAIKHKRILSQFMVPESHQE